MITRQRFSADVYAELRTRLIRGEYAPGQKLKDCELAEQLGVSRTPVREALMRLEREGFVKAQKHLGFSAAEFRESEIREVYPLVELLECAALADSPLPSPETLKKLKVMGRSLAGPRTSALRRVEMDSGWHRLLLDQSENHHLNRVLADLKGLLFRYEYRFMQHDQLVKRSAQEHEAVTASLAAKDRKRALRLLKEHWRRCAQDTLAEFRKESL